MTYTAILITGGAGFAGSTIALSMKRRYPGARIVVMDSLKRRGSELNIYRLRENGIEFIHGDIRNREDFPQIDYDAIIECSAEPSVLAGIKDNPFYVINTNLVGTINCLEEARIRKADIFFLSTSRIYPVDLLNRLESREEETRFVWNEEQTHLGWSRDGVREDFPLGSSRSLYGMSKLCSELVIQEYSALYGLRSVINRCGVIAGPWQFGKVDQGVFTLWMLAHYFKKEGLSYIGFGGSGKQVRDLIHSEDIADLIVLQSERIDEINGYIYNVGGGAQNNLSLYETTKLCEEITGNVLNIGMEPLNRPMDLRIYIGDTTKLSREMNWSPARSSREILKDIFLWIRENEMTIKKLLI